ncbi:ExbD/TolR family protein [Phaeocystidibacter luteus]|uniref:Biopolymer transporter ExbD n=1 Tax=Phaeocystidibacter luteus TaxID=911197 RepID=A0A6N6RDD3_9FLAO|nr:biopolymer transporter ExbD [Phaeocystidibacter luteus]KAB2807034.1 biopolymer transporter ExbD [Phaeocystidibacter luteus]
MARKKREIAEINAGSMADIAFLLLIFFLVTTTMDIDKGLNRKLPPIDEEQTEQDNKIKKKNIFEVVVNANNDLLVEQEYMELTELREAAMNFIDNNGDGSCEECQGFNDPTSSDNPGKAIISVSSDRGTSYKTYVTVTNELIAAYNDLREGLSQRKFGKSVADLTEEQRDFIADVYPQIISEAEPVQIGG